MNKKSLKKNYFYNLCYQLFVMILPLLITPYISRVLGAEEIGIYSYTTSITAFFIMLGTLGINIYGQREVAYVQDDVEKRSKIFWELIILRTITIIISSTIYYFLFVVNNKYSLFYKILLFEIIAYIFDISWFFQGMEDFKKVAIRNILVKFLLMIQIFIFVKSVNDLWIYILIYTLSIFFGNCTFWIKIKKYVIFPEKIDLKKHIKPMLLLFLPQVAVQIYTVLDKTMIGIILGNMSKVGYYEQAQKIVKLILSIITTFGTVMLPRISYIYVNQNEKELKEKINLSFNFVWFLGFPIVFGLLSISSIFVPIFFGKGYDEVSILIKVFTPIVLIIGCANVIGIQYLIPTKKQNYYTFSVIIGALVNVVFNLILIPNFEAIGAAIASVLAELTGLLIQIYFVRKIFDFKYIFKKSINYLLSAFIMFIICVFINNVISNNLISLILQVIIGIMLYFGILILIKDDLILKILNRGDLNEKNRN